MRKFLFQGLDEAADGAFVIDQDQTILYWNMAAQHLLEFTALEVIGQPCYKILKGRDENHCRICRLECVITQQALRHEGIESYLTRVKTKQGKLRWLQMSILTFYAPNEPPAPLIVHLFRNANHIYQRNRFAHQIVEAAIQLQNNLQTASEPSTTPQPLSDILTNREYEVLTLLVEGLNTRHIARTLSISYATTRNHIQNILHKLQVHSRLEAVAYAIDHGFIQQLK